MNRQEAIHIIKNNWPNGRHMLSEALEFLIPELKEGEDKKLIKEIISIVKSYRESCITEGNHRFDDCIAWLEKQCTKESKKISIWKHWKDGIAGNGASKLIYLIKDGNDYSLSSVLGRECDYVLLSDLDKLMLQEKQGEQIDIANQEYWRGYREGKQEIIDKYSDLGKQCEQKPADKKYTFNAIPRLLSMIQPTDRAKAYCQKLIDILIQEGYSADAKIVGNCLKQMNGEKIAMATMDKQEPSIPSNLDEAAENYYENDCPYDGEARVVNREHDVWFPSQAIEDAFKAGAEWMAGQKPAEWSEEDEKNYNTILRIIRDSDVSAQSANRLASWLKLNIIQSKQEWSEEDEKILEIVTSVLQVNFELNERFSGYEEYMNADLINWLKSLKERMKGE